MWWHLALGRLITTSGIPAHEPFSFLPAAHAWVGQQWLYEVTLAGLVGAGGAGLASLVMGLAAVAAVVLAALSIPRSARISGPWLAIAMVITGLVLNSVAGVTSAVISVLGFAIVLFVVTRWREGMTSAVWGLPPLFLLWANMDAGFAAGLLLVLAALLLLPKAATPGGGRRQLALALGVSAVAVLVNPLGPGIYASVLSGVFNPGVAQSLAGFGTPNFHEWWARLFEAEVVLVIVLWTVSGGPDRFSAITGFGLVIATLYAQENLGLFAIFMAPQLAIHGSRAWSLHVVPRVRRRPEDGTRHLHPVLISAVLVAMTAAMAVAVIPKISTSAAASYQATTYPEAAATFAGTAFPGSASTRSIPGADTSRIASHQVASSSSMTNPPFLATTRSRCTRTSISSTPTGSTCSPARIFTTRSSRPMLARRRHCTCSDGSSTATTRRARAW